MRPKVLVTRNIPENTLDELFKVCDVDHHDSNEAIPRRELLFRVRDIDGLINIGTRVDEELISNAPNLKVISNHGAGFDRVDIQAATRRGIIVTNTPDVVTEATAEMTFGLMLTVTRRIVELDRILRNKVPFRWGPMQMLGFELTGKTLGIVGLGRIGQSVARRAKAFGMKVIYYQRNPRAKEIDENERFFYKPLDELLKQSDVISIHVPLTENTYHLIDEREFNLMKKGAYIINTSRGPVINEEALVCALKSGHLGGAGLDVFEREPQIHPDLLEFENTVLTPHVGTSTLETRTAMIKLAIKNLLMALEGKIPPNVVNPEVYS